MIKAGIRHVTGDALFVDAYPSVATVEDYHCNILIKITQDLGLQALHDRIKVDTVMLDYISRLVRFNIYD